MLKLADTTVARFHDFIMSLRIFSPFLKAPGSGVM